MTNNETGDPKAKDTKNIKVERAKASDTRTQDADSEIACECDGACDDASTNDINGNAPDPDAHDDTNVDKNSDENIAELSETNAALLKDIQRLQADFENYRKRIDKEREKDAIITRSAFVEKLLPILDSCGQARRHGELTGAFELVTKKLHSILEQAGLQPFGEVGEAFDPKKHEAVSVVLNNSLPDHSITEVLQIGYTFQDKLIRVAKVIITDNFDPQDAA